MLALSGRHYASSCSKTIIVFLSTSVHSTLWCACFIASTAVLALETICFCILCHVSDRLAFTVCCTSACLMHVCIGDDGGCFAEADEGKGCCRLSAPSWDGQYVFLFAASLYALLRECNKYTYGSVYGLSACVCMYNMGFMCVHCHV